MVALGPGADLTGSFEFFEDSEGHEGYDALAIGGMFPYFDAVVVTVVVVFAVEVGSLAFVDVLATESEGNGIDFFAAELHVVL